MREVLEDEELCQELAEHLQLTPVVSTRWALVPGGLGRLHQDMGRISQMEVLFAEKIWGNHLQMEVFNGFHGKKSKKSMEVCCSPGESYRLPGGFSGKPWKC